MQQQLATTPSSDDMACRFVRYFGSCFCGAPKRPCAELEAPTVLPRRSDGFTAALTNQAGEGAASVAGSVARMKLLIDLDSIENLQ